MVLIASYTLNSAKCKVSKTELKLLGHVIGVRADPAKIEAVLQMLAPQNVAWSISYPNLFPIVLTPYSVRKMHEFGDQAKIRLSQP